MTIVTFTHKVIGSILAFENFQSQGNGQRGCGGTVLDQGGGSILPHSTQTIMITPPLCGFPASTESHSSSYSSFSQPLWFRISKPWKGSHPHHCWCRRQRDKFFVNIGRRRKKDRWNMTTVDSFNVLQSKGGAPRTIKWSKQQNKSFDVFDWPSFNIFDWLSTEFWYFS